MKLYSLGILRILFGWLFFWAFLDKLFGLGFSTPRNSAWILGNSPTEGFLSQATSGPFQDFFVAISGSPVIDWLFMLGLCGLGIAFLLGIGMRIAAVSGTLLLFLMWFSLLPTKNNPFLDEHILYICSVWVLFYYNAGDVLGFGRWWKQTTLVQRVPFLG